MRPACGPRNQWPPSRVGSIRTPSPSPPFCTYLKRLVTHNAVLVARHLRVGRSAIDLLVTVVDGVRDAPPPRHHPARRHRARRGRGHLAGGSASRLRSRTTAVTRSRWLTIGGASGSGKSTLLTVLLGLLTPSAGRLEAAGLDVDRTAGPAHWRGRVAWCPQEAHVFDSTIRANLLLARPASSG